MRSLFFETQSFISLYHIFKEAKKGDFVADEAS